MRSAPQIQRTAQPQKSTQIQRTTHKATHKPATPAWPRPTAIIGRLEEKAAIAAFVNSRRPLLRISGGPGTGKTATVTAVLSDFVERGLKAVYLNAFTNSEAADEICRAEKTVLVIDEYDRLEREKGRVWVARAVGGAVRRGCRVIAISNGLSGAGLRFRPYTRGELLAIAGAAGRVVGRGRGGDARVARQEALAEVALTGEALAGKALAETALTGKALAGEALAGGGVERSVHREMIGRLAETAGSFGEVLRAYVAECVAARIPRLSRADVRLIYDLL